MQEISSDVSEEAKSLSTTSEAEIGTSPPMQEQISFECITKCNQVLITASDRIPRGVNSKFDLLYDQASDLHRKLFLYFYDLFSKERELTPGIKFDGTNKFTTRKEALEYYQAAKRVFNELEKNGIHSSPVERSLAALKQVVSPTAEEEPEEAEINECASATSSTVSTEVKPLRAIPGSGIDISSSGIFTFFKKKSINPGVFHAIWPIPISIIATYFVSAIYDASSGAHSLDFVNKFFGSKTKDASSFADGLKTPGFIYGLATLMTVAFIGIYLYKKNKHVNAEQSALITNQTTMNNN
jgi:hypothetical protein